MKAATRQTLVTSAQLAHAVGVTLSTIHYYTILGLLHVRERAGNKRLYDAQAATASIEEIRRLRQRGYSLTVIREQMSQKGGGP